MISTFTASVRTFQRRAFNAVLSLLLLFSILANPSVHEIEEKQPRSEQSITEAGVHPEIQPLFHQTKSGNERIDLQTLEFAGTAVSQTQATTLTAQKVQAFSRFRPFTTSLLYTQTTSSDL